MNTEQANRMRNDKGFIAALDQSGGSTPKALRLYGISEDAYKTDAEMFDLVHQMRTRIMTSPSFTGEKILAAILFEDTMDREVDGLGTAEYLWTRKRIVPILKVDKGLTDEVDGAKLMKPIPQLAELLQRALAKGVSLRQVLTAAQLAGLQFDAPAAGRSVRELGLPKECLLIAIRREDGEEIPSGDTVVREGDYLTFLVNGTIYSSF